MWKFEIIFVTHILHEINDGQLRVFQKLPFRVEISSRLISRIAYMSDNFLNFHTVYRKTMWGKIQGEKKFKCDKCPKMFARRGSLVRHIAERKGELQYQCEYCEKMFFVKKGLDYHIDTRHLNQDLAMSVEPPEGEEAPAEDEDFGQISMIVKCKSKLGSKKSKKEGSEDV